MEYSSVPKNMSRVQEEAFGLPFKYIAVLVISAFLALILVVLALAGYKIALVLLFFEILIFFNYAKTPSILRRSWLRYMYFIAGTRGENLTSKYEHNETIIKSIVPIEEIHSGGLIQFANKVYGRLLICDPPRISDDDLDGHIHRIRALVDSLHGELIIKSYAVSVPSSVRPAERALLQLLNENKDRTQEEQEHLYSLYQDTQQNENIIIQWRFYMFVGFGKFDNLEAAKIAETQYLPGIQSRLHKSDLHIRPLNSHAEIVASYRSMFQLSEVL